MFGKTMSIPDTMIYRYFELATNVPNLDSIKKVLEEGSVNPRDLKVSLGQEIVCSFYGDEAATEAYERFTAMFVKKEVPDDIVEMPVPDAPIPIVDFLFIYGLTQSKTEARRLIESGAVSIDSKKITDIKTIFRPATTGTILKVGKRKFLKVFAQ